MEKALVVIIALVALCIAVLVAIAVLLPGVYVNDGNVVSAVEKQGYRDVKITSSHVFFISWRGCSAGDDACYKIQAINPQGERVDVIACAGWPFKGVTVRTK